MLGFVLHSPGNDRTRAACQGPASRSPLLGQSWAHRAGSWPTTPYTGEWARLLLGLRKEGQLWFLGPRNTLGVSLPYFNPVYFKGRRFLLLFIHT